MDTLRTLAGWLLFLAMAIVAGFFWHQSAERGDCINKLSDTIAQMNSQIGLLSDSIDSLEAQVEEEAKTIAALRSQIDAVDIAPTPEDEDADNDDEISFGNMLDALMEGDGSETPDMGMLGSMMEMFDSPQGEQMLEAGVTMSMNMQFADFFDMLAPETVEAAREILGNFMIHTARYGMSFMDAENDADMDTALNTMTAERDNMLAELRSVIGEDGVALFEQYEEELPGKMMDQTLRMQLGMFAGGLSAETQDIVRNTLVEELLAVQPDNTTTIPNALEARNVMESQDEAYARALERLSVAISEEEYVVVERFVDQQQQMVNMFSSMMLPDAEKNSP